MSFFSEERASELKDLFFESASELLQALNEEGLELEKRPGDAEVVRSVRRTIHTLKGDSAACGFRELSELAHELEDVLTPELAQKGNGRVAEVVLTAADVFHSMLSAYRNNSQPPAGDGLLHAIHQLTTLTSASANGASHIVDEAKQAAPAARFQWSEYEQMVIQDALQRGLKVVEVSLTIDPNCIVRAAALQMAKNALQDLGNILILVPDDNSPTDNLEKVEAALTTSFDEEYVNRKCRIPAVISEVFVSRRAALNTEPEIDLLGILPTEEPLPPPQPAANAAAAAASAAKAAQVPPEEAGQSASLSAAPESTLRVDSEKIDEVLNLVGELIIGKSMLTQTMNEFDKKFAKDPLRSKFADAMAFQARVLNDLQKSVMKVRMVPVEQLFRRFPRVVRDVAKVCGKEVGLVMTGQDTDLDKSILDVMAEPLAHLVRNAIGHGIETPIDRMAAGKPTQGTLRLNAYHQGNHIVIEVSDDGAGIDREKVVSKAIEKGIIRADEAIRLTEGEALNLIFHPGFSTADEVTSVSGRGVGMDVVKSVLERLKGSVHIETRAGHGTTFFLKVPLTLAIIKALMFRVGDRQYAVPLGSVLEITRAQESEIHRVDNHEVIKLRDQVLTLVRLNKLTKKAPSKQKKIFVVVISLGDRRFGLVVDKLVGEEELVIKAMDDHLVATDLVSGASILGDGTVVLILNIQSVVTKLGKQGRDQMSAGASA